MRGMGTPALGFSAAANALASPISPPWAIGGTVRRVVSRSCALGSNGAHTAPCRSNREVCMSGRTSASWRCLPTTRPYEIRVQATLEKPDQISTMPTCGDNAETDLRVLAGGRIAEPQLQSGHADRRNQCLSGVKRTWLIALHMSAYDPKADIGHSRSPWDVRVICTCVPPRVARLFFGPRQPLEGACK